MVISKYVDFGKSILTLTLFAVLISLCAISLNSTIASTPASAASQSTRYCSVYYPYTPYEPVSMSFKITRYTNGSVLATQTGSSGDMVSRAHSKYLRTYYSSNHSAADYTKYYGQYYTNITSRTPLHAHVKVDIIVSGSILATRYCSVVF